MDRITGAIEAVSSRGKNVIDLTAIHTLRIGIDTFIPVAGALDGRDAIGDRACGYTADDLEELAKGLRDLQGRRWILAWQATARRAGEGPAATDQQVDVGSRPLARLSDTIAASGGIFAWPHLQAMRMPPMATPPGGNRSVINLVVSRLVGPALERADGSRVPPGFVLLSLGAGGLKFLESRFITNDLH
jgi:hypothetical protein